MADILIQMFRTFMSHTGQQGDPGGTRAATPTPGSALVVGEHSRSVLLLAAVTAAAELGIKVLFFAQAQIQSLPVSLQKVTPNLSPESLKKIKFSYPRTVEELLQQVASLHESTHTSPTPPSLIIVDRLDGFLCGPGGGSRCGFHPGKQSCAAHLSALLCDTAAFLTRVLEQQAPGSAPCRVIASFKSEVDTGDSSATDPILDVLHRYFQVRCTLDQDRSYEAAAAGLQELWHVYLSGTDTAQTSCTKDSEARPGVAQEWQMLIFPDGLMEFKLV